MATSLLRIAGLIGLGLGIALLFAARSAIHEIEAFLLLIIAAVCLSGATVADAVRARGVGQVENRRLSTLAEVEEQRERDGRA